MLTELVEKINWYILTLWLRIKEFFLDMSSTKELRYESRYDHVESNLCVPEVPNVTELEQLPTVQAKKTVKKKVSKKKAVKKDKRQLLQEVEPYDSYGDFDGTPDWMDFDGAIKKAKVKKAKKSSKRKK